MAFSERFARDSARRVAFAGPRLVALPWYDGPTTHEAFDAFWVALRSNLIDAGFDALPTRLERAVSPKDQWNDPSLLLSQCCGLDLFTPAGAGLRCLANPIFAELDCDEGHYFSFVVQRTASDDGDRIAVNALSSRSGCTALLRWLEQNDRPGGRLIVTGSHEASLEAVRHGYADVAAIDAQSWSTLSRRGVTVVGRTAPAPSPPFVTSSTIDADALFSALAATVDRHGAKVGLLRIRRAARADYEGLRREAQSTARPEVLSILDPRLTIL